MAAEPLWKYGARRQLAQDWTLDLTDVGTIAGDQRAPRIGEDTILTRERTGCASEREDQQAGNVEGRWLVGSGMAMPIFNGVFTE